MLDLIYFPVSFLLWGWHEIFGSLFGAANAGGWVLAIAFLVFTLRAVLVKPAVDHIRSMERTKRLQPKREAIRKKHTGDTYRQSLELQRLHRDHGVKPLRGCLPMLLQAPVFIGLHHVLRSFADSRGAGNYAFSASDVQSYLDAALFHVHLSDTLLAVPALVGRGVSEVVAMWHVAPVAVPLMVVAAVATHLAARASVNNQAAAGAAGQSKVIARITMYGFPLVAIVAGTTLPVGLLVYWVSNNLWTLAQQHLVVRRLKPWPDEP